jgi:hypothetical protein
MRNLLIVLILLIANFCQGQINVLSTTWSEILITPSALAKVNVNNLSNSPTVAQIRVVVSDINSNQLLEVLSSPLTIKLGVSFLSPTGFQEIRYARNSTADYLRTQNALPIGSYNFCIEIIAAEVEVLETYCETIQSTRDEFLTLISPSDGDSIYSSYPNLVWNHSGNFGDGIERFYRIIVAVKHVNQTNEGALSLNSPHWVSPPQKSHVLSYPQGAPTLVKGLTYVWQVQLLINGTIAQTSEVWNFSLAMPPIVQDIKYINLSREKFTPVFNAYQTIFLRFDEPFNSENLRVMVQDETSKPIILPFVIDGANSGRASGDTFLLNVDVSQLIPQEKPYKLEISNGQGISYNLSFFKK